jgi:hypothetical protein
MKEGYILNKIIKVKKLYEFIKKEVNGLVVKS